MKLRAVAALLALALLAAVPTAAAHKTAYSADGKIRIVWGFLDEPAVTMAKNGLDLRVVDNATGYAIPDLQDDLQAELHYGEEHLEMDLTGQFGKPGSYTFTVTPSRPGVYALHLAGTVNGTELDLEIPGAHALEAIEETYFPKVEAADNAALAEKVATLEAKVAALEAKAKAQSETPTPVSSVSGKDAPGFGVLAALGAVAVVVLLRRRA